jgi:hypothetical protein
VLESVYSSVIGVWFVYPCRYKVEWRADTMNCLRRSADEATLWRLVRTVKCRERDALMLHLPQIAQPIGQR